MLGTLIKKQLLELFQTYYVDKKTGKARKKAGTVLFFLLFAVIMVGLGFVFYNISTSMGAYVLNRGINWLYFAMLGLLSIALGLFGSVFNTYASVYLPKDNELLLSLPIPAKKLLLARTTSVYLMSLLYSGWIWIPAIIAYYVMVPLTVTNIVFPILLTFVIALFVSILSCLLGFVVAIIASKAKGKSFLTVALSLIVMVGYYVVYFKIVNSLDEVLLHLDEWGDTVKSWLHYVYYLGLAADGEIVPMLVITGLTILGGYICLTVLSKSFLKIAITSDKTKKKENVKVDFSAVSPEKALLKREFKHFTSVPAWMLNGGLGLLLLPIGTITAIIKHDAIRGLLEGMTEESSGFMAALPVLVVAAICLVISTNVITPVSISIEGKSLWIMQSLPVDSWKIIRAKESMGVRLNSIPVAFAVIAFGKILQYEMWQIMLMFFTALVYIYFNADMGLMLNLKKPNFSWTSEASVTKEGLPVLLSMFGGWIICIVIAIIGGNLCDIVSPYCVMAGIAVLFLIIREIVFFWLKNKGSKLLAHM